MGVEEDGRLADASSPPELDLPRGWKKVSLMGKLKMVSQNSLMLMEKTSWFPPPPDLPDNDGTGTPPPTGDADINKKKGAGSGKVDSIVRKQPSESVPEGLNGGIDFDAVEDEDADRKGDSDKEAKAVTAKSSTGKLPKKLYTTG